MNLQIFIKDQFRTMNINRSLSNLGIYGDHENRKYDISQLPIFFSYYNRESLTTQGLDLLLPDLPEQPPDPLLLLKHYKTTFHSGLYHL